MNKLLMGVEPDLIDRQKLCERDPEFSSPCRQMQIADYISNNDDRHDHAFSGYGRILSQTTKEEKTLFEAAVEAQMELQMDLQRLLEMECPEYLEERQGCLWMIYI